MRTERFVISDRTWFLIEPLLPGKASDCGVTAKDNRLFLEAVSPLGRARGVSPYI